MYNDGSKNLQRFLSETSPAIEYIDRAADNRSSYPCLLARMVEVCEAHENRCAPKKSRLCRAWLVFVLVTVSRIEPPIIRDRVNPIEPLVMVQIGFVSPLNHARDI